MLANPRHATATLPRYAQLWLNYPMTMHEALEASPAADDPSPLRALVLAGSRSAETDTVARHAGVSCKAFAPVAGRPMVERVLQTLFLEGRIGHVEVALPGHGLPADQAPELAGWINKGLVHRHESGRSPAATVAAALERAPDGCGLLVTTGDHALLNPAILSQFLERCEASPGCDALAGLLPLAVLETKYPNMERTGLRLRDGRYSGCNLFLFRGGHGARALVSFWLRLETLRKSPWRMARILGPLTLIRYTLRRLTLAEAVARIDARTGARVGTVMLDIPEAAIDVDTPGHLMLAEDLAREPR